MSFLIVATNATILHFPWPNTLKWVLPSRRKLI